MEPQQTIVDRQSIQLKNSRRPLGYPGNMKPTTGQTTVFRVTRCEISCLKTKSFETNIEHISCFICDRHCMEPHDFHSLSLHKYSSKAPIAERPRINPTTVNFQLKAALNRCHAKLSLLNSYLWSICSIQSEAEEEKFLVVSCSLLLAEYSINVPLCRRQ